MSVELLRDSLIKFVTFRLISKKSYLEGVFEFLHPDPQLDQSFKPTRNLCGQLLTIYISIYIHDLYTHKV